MRDATEPTQTTKGLSLLAKVSNPKGIRNTFYWKHSFSSNKDPSTVFYINTLHSRGILISIKVNIIFEAKSGTSKIFYHHRYTPELSSESCQEN